MPVTDETETATGPVRAVEADAEGDGERPAHMKSPLWDHLERIEKMLGARYSYQQIANALARRGVQLTASEVGKWCRRRGLRSCAPSRHKAGGADKKAAPAGPAPAPHAAPSAASAAPSSESPPRRGSLSQMLADDEHAARAAVDQFFRPKSEE